MKQVDKLIKAVSAYLEPIGEKERTIELKNELLQQETLLHEKNLETMTEFVKSLNLKAKPKERIVNLNDVKLVWITEQHYLIRKEGEFKSEKTTIKIEGKQFSFFFDTSQLTEKSRVYRAFISMKIKNIKKTSRQVQVHILLNCNPVNNNFNLNDFIDSLSKALNLKTSPIKKAINSYWNRNEIEYFIPKNPKEFLQEQFNYWKYKQFISNRNNFGIFVQLGDIIINFLIDILHHELNRWLKIKPILETHFVITLDRILEIGGMKLLMELSETEGWKMQMQEWMELGFISEPISLKTEILPKPIQFLPLDTKYFNFSFSEIINEKIIDGWLIFSENFQALNFLLPLFKEKVKAIYIDPPFNLGGQNRYKYKTNYKNSTWITLLENRLSIAKHFLQKDGSIFVRCDHNGNMLVRLLMDQIFSPDNFRNEIQIKRIVKKGFNAKRYPVANDSLFFYSKSNNHYFNPFRKKLTKPKKPYWHDMTSMNLSISGGKAKKIFGAKISPPKGRGWTFSQKKIDELEKQEKIRIRCPCGYIHRKGTWKGCPECGLNNPKVDYLIEERKDFPIDSNWTDIQGYTSSWEFQTENSEELLERVILTSTKPHEYVMDFFAGSGTTIAVAHKLKRKWIGIEIGDHFWTVILPRMKKVLFFDPKGISSYENVKENYNANKAGGCFKYIWIQPFEQNKCDPRTKKSNKIK